MLIIDQWQKEVLEAKGDILLCTGRRVGKTYILARKAIDRMAKVGKTKVVVVSLTEDQAMLILAMSLNYARENYDYLVEKGKERPTLKTLTFKNGSKMISRPVGQTGDSIRGFEGGILIVDEASRMPPQFWIAAKPIILTTCGEIWMASTPHGKEGYFWKRFDESYNKKEPKARYKPFYVTTEQVIRDRPISESWNKEQKEAAEKILAEDKNEMSILEYGQEYLGLFLDDLRQYFNDNIINACCTGKREEFPRRTDNYMGVDVARYGGDEITYEVFNRKNQNSVKQVENIVKKEQSTTQTESEIKQLTNIWQCEKVGIDAGAGSLGVGIYDRLILNLFMKRKVVPMNNREIVLDREGKHKQRIFKEEMYDNLKSMMEKGEITMLDDDGVKDSLKSIQIEYKEDGTTHIFGSYAHIVEGIIRAAWLCKKEKINKLWIKYL